MSTGYWRQMYTRRNEQYYDIIEGTNMLVFEEFNIVQIKGARGWKGSEAPFPNNINRRKLWKK